MSECVVHMEIPTKDKACGMVFDFDGIWYCPVEQRICHQPDYRDIPSWCPIICQLPEWHGRLGDLDEIGRKINRARIRAMQDGQDTNPYWECGDIIASEQTIVPAEAERSET